MPSASLLCLPPGFPPPWASRWGEDVHGLFAGIRVRGVSAELRWIPPGSFLMGSDRGEKGRWEDEGPRHRVTLTKGSWLGTTQVTQELWKAVMAGNPSHFGGEENLPVDSVSWEDCQSFCERLGALLPGLLVRLPTEAEWEYACRAGTESALNDGSPCTSPEGRDRALDRLGWYRGNSDGKTHPVGRLLPNAWGLYDMHGNVREWCLDGEREYTADPATDPVGPMEAGADRVIRGGSYWDQARICRSAVRGWRAPGDRGRIQGFRFAAGQPVPSGAMGTASGRRGAPRPRDEGTTARDHERSGLQ